MEESVFIEHAKKGDLNSFNQLVLKYQEQVFNLACRMMNDETTAQDISQDTFISAYKNIRSFRGGSFRAWLLRIATNNCYDEMRRKKRTDDGEFPEEFIESRELGSAIQRCIDQLQDNFKAVIILVDVHGFGYEEASRIASTPIGTVRSRLARARQRVQDCLQQFWELLPEKYRLNSGRKL